MIRFIASNLRQTSKSQTSKPKSSKLKPIDESQLRCAFEMFDTNHDGKVNQDEMKSMLTKLGITVPDDTVKQLLAIASKNGVSLALCV